MFFSEQRGEPQVLRFYSAAIEMSAYALENRSMVTDVTVSIMEANQTLNNDSEKLPMLQPTIVVSVNSCC